VSRYQKGKTNPDFTEAKDSEWQWHRLGHMQVCTLLQTDSHAMQHPTTQFFTGRMPFLTPNQQSQSTEGNWLSTLVQQNQQLLISSSSSSSSAALFITPSSSTKHRKHARQ